MEAQKPNKPANTSKKKTGINAFLVIIHVCVRAW